MPEIDEDVIPHLQQRTTDLTEWLQKESPECFTEQKHLDPGTQERVYWHFGYLSALNDVLGLLLNPKKKPT